MNRQEDQAKNVTIQDVAKRAGVAVSTASMALNNKPVISSETKEIVSEAAQDLGYRPTAAARALVSGELSNLGLLIPVREDDLFFSIDFFQKLISGMSRATKETGNLLSLQVVESGEETREQVTKASQTKNLSGSIIAYPATEVPFDVIEKLGYPVVFLGEPPRDFPYLHNDNFSAAKTATGHLIEHGHEKIGFLGGPDRLIASQAREKGYRNALESAGIKVDPGYIWNSRHNAQSAYRKIREKARDLDFTAICISVEEQVVSVYRALRDLELSVPEDVSLVAIGDSQLARNINPTMTVVDLHPERLGYLAMEKLIDLTNEKKVASKETIQGDLIRRESCGCKSREVVTANSR